MATIQEIIDNRNITDQFKGMTDDFIKGEQETRRCDLITIAVNLTNDFNKSSALRTHSSYAGKRFIFLNRPNNQLIGHPEGSKSWDKRGAVGVQNYNTVEHYSVDRCEELFTELKKEGYTIYAVDNHPNFNPESVHTVKFPKKTAIVLGEEQVGIPDEIVEACDKMVYIPQSGVSPRSLNVSVAHGIVAYSWVGQHTQS